MALVIAFQDGIVKMTFINIKKRCFSILSFADQFYKIKDIVSRYLLIYLFIYLFIFRYSICLNLSRYIELSTDDLHFFELCGIHGSVIILKIHSLHQMNLEMLSN